jgi:NitT/TauT family transport system substrate-binding protein
MDLTRRAFGGLALSALAVRPGWAADPIKFTTLIGIEYTPPLYAQAKGLFAKHGVKDIDVQVSPQAPILLPAVVSGSLQIGVSTGIQVAMAHEQGLDLVLLSGTGGTTKAHPILAAVVRNGVEINNAADFVGKTVVSPGFNGTGYVLFVRWLKENGVDPKQVHFVEGGFARMADIMRGGNADAALAIPPFLDRMVKSGLGKRLDYVLPEQDYLIVSFYIARRDWAEKHLDEVKGINAALKEANDAMKADREASNAFIAKTLKLPPDVIAAQPPPNTHPFIRPEDVQFWIDIAADQGLIKKRFDAKDIMVG